MSSVISYERFAKARRFDHLDGLRAVSVLLVLADHSHDRIWEPLHGGLGVIVFFVISGFIITTLLLREEDNTGEASIKNFYIRRVFRIFPLYYLALACFTVLTLMLNLSSDRDGYIDNLPYYVTYMNEFGQGGTFGHSWSLGVEEKFYLIWPLLAFGLVWVRSRRAAMAAGLLLLFTLSVLFPPLDYLAIYVPIVGGCLVALFLHSEGAFDVISRMAAPVATVLLIGFAVAVGVVDDGAEHAHPWFGLAVTLAFPALLLNRVAIRVLAWTPLVFIGLRSYAVYLFHPIVGSAVEKVLPEGEPGLFPQLLRIVLLIGGSVAVANALFRTVEQPMIRAGRRITHSRLPPREVDPEPTA